MRRMVAAAVLTLSSLSTLSAHALVGDLFVTLPAVEFRGGSLTSVTFEDAISAYCTESLCELATSAELPHGARLVGIEMDGCRDTASDAPIAFYLVRRFANDFTDLAGDKIEVMATGSITAAGCDYYFGTVDESKHPVINTFGNEYLVVIVIGTIPCTPNCPDLGTRFQAVRIYYEPNEAGGPVEPTKPTGVPSFLP